MTFQIPAFSDHTGAPPANDSINITIRMATSEGEFPYFQARFKSTK